MRHATAVLSLKAGARLEEVSQLLGHSSISITKDIYVSHVPELSNRAIVRMDEFIGSSTAFTPRVSVGS